MDFVAERSGGKIVDKKPPQERRNIPIDEQGNRPALLVDPTRNLSARTKPTSQTRSTRSQQTQESKATQIRARKVTANGLKGHWSEGAS
ncbi:hypothetical protein CDL15_Pgr015591 [Punica granatum]|uniref:Uncharacterized protein n=1 Tax=Punica granatum TaxID=22663 RepID=A0A218XPJ3_PUNGR|nr:hypothetical protein CDL15_Pgr015591 [Punica granatum]